MQIGYVGLGNMGGALARRLQLSHTLRVFDLNKDAVANLESAGATAASDLPDLARNCDVIFLCLPTSDHVHSAIFGPAGLIEGIKAGTVLIDQTTGFPDQTRHMAGELEKVGVSLVDAPVSGGRTGANAGTIAIMVGASEAQFREIEPILKDISSNVFHTGGVGNGQVVKIVNNLVSFTQRLLTLEALSLAHKNGVAPDVVAGVLSTSTAQNGYMHRILPKVLKGDLEVGFTIGLTVKDMALASRLGQESNVPTLFTDLAKELYEHVSHDFGAGAEAETSGLFMEKQAGTKFIPN